MQHTIVAVMHKLGGARRGAGSRGCLVFLLTAAILALARPACAQDDPINPDRPGIADGSTVIGAHRLQLETGWQYDVQDAEGQRSRLTSIPTLVRLGVSRRFELRIEGDTFSRQTADAAVPVQTGFAPISAGLKYQIVDGAGSQASFGVIARVFPPSGSGAFTADHVQADVRVAADWNVARGLSLNPNAGLARTESDAGHVFSAGLFAVTLNYQPTDRLNPFVDIGAQIPGAPGEPASTLLDWGLGWIVGRNVQVDASVGHRLRGTAPHPFVSVGVSVRGGHGTH